MKSKLLFIITFLLITNKGFSQDEKQIASRNGVKISYQLILEDEGKKKDKYILVLTALNESDDDLYYEVVLTKNKEGKWNLPITPEGHGFTKIKARNATGLFGKGKSIIGDNTKYVTKNMRKLFVLKKGAIYSKETTFKVKKGEKPLITNTFTSSLKKINEFDLKISSDMLEGNYNSSCGDFSVNISTGNSSERGDFLTQTTNGKQFIWIRSTTSTFVRENSTDYSLTFNQSTNTFTYTTTDGITCIWKRND